MKLFLCLLLLGGISFTIPCSGSEKSHSVNVSLQKKLSYLPENERLILEHFFQILIESDGLGYTLFGSKTVCLSAYFTFVPLGNMIRGCNSNVIKKGWYVWKKYEHYFPHPHYLIFEETEIVDQTEIHSIYIINKVRLLDTLKKHHQLFAQELSVDFEPNFFLSEIEKRQSLLEALNQHEGLLGVLLGYGAESSMHYHDRNLVWKFGLPISYAETDLQAVSANSFESSFFSSGIQPMHFVGNLQSQEVKTILEQNAKERAYLLDIYSQGKFLEITLSKLME